MCCRIGAARVPDGSATYFWIACAMLGASLAFRVWIDARAHRRGERVRVLPTVVAATVLVVLTVVFDNVMILADLFQFDHDQLIGIYLGVAPIEDLSYPLCTAILLPAVWRVQRKGRVPSSV
ncbi:lycopene cyclase domain-containing protein [Leucobacter tardus]|uniref:Lycopene cyclase domain-containing protein n=1 Tax=Leucobacter tardus TaxID=501483 RepID=A0A939QCR8_9MICO|nr:lycopene cyclase domain-containing protein [Leucobacter tardus]